MDNQLEKILETLKQDFPSAKLSRQEVIEISVEVKKEGQEPHKKPVVTLFLEDKYAQFHDEFAQIGKGFKELRSLVDYLDANGYSLNLD